MKKNKKKLPKWLVGSMKVEWKQDFDLKDILNTALDKYNVKDLLEYMFAVTTNKGLTYGFSMMRILANEKDMEDVKSMILLKYLLDNWDKKDFVNKAAKNFGEVMKRAEKRKEEENNKGGRR